MLDFLRLHIDLTPSPTDPKGAAHFYEALGLAVVAIGRLENHFLDAVINILGLPETAHLAKRFPMTFSERKRIWERAFAGSIALRAMQVTAKDFIRQLDDFSEDRTVIARSQWGPFAIDEPLRIVVTLPRHKDGSRYGLDIRQGEILLSQVLSILDRANDLTASLLPISRFIEDEITPPGSTGAFLDVIDGGGAAAGSARTNASAAHDRRHDYPQHWGLW